jgi:hypothetical protein
MSTRDEVTNNASILLIDQIFERNHYSRTNLSIEPNPAANELLQIQNEMILITATNFRVNLIFAAGNRTWTKRNQKMCPPVMLYKVVRKNIKSRNVCVGSLCLTITACCCAGI